MTAKPAPIDISDKPELAEFVRELLASGQSRELRRGDEVLGVLSPAAHNARPKHREPTAEDIAAFESAAGGWAGNIDIDAFHEALAESRRRSISKEPAG